ncbi:2-polyprenyl-3-methyl-5-hydroxy-6-metoxy-1,4-benzoquinol methylase [Paenibacillus sacheonensis]|nr:2-polyprenyl-3-methyl-5-hydroxy-6-metoxy-1,4-benzoquinol methylase [Paenibacillus sacheonensis]
MKQNKYDDNGFFANYSRMSRSIDGLEAAGEWHSFRQMLPELSGKRVLDIGCGFGWHCRYASEQGAASVVGIDISANMLARR